MISVVIPARDNAETIGHVIKTCQEVADEIIVVDGFSVDKTREIAEKMGARMFIQKRLGNRKGEAMREGLNAVQGDIVLFVDADIRNIKPSWIRKLVKPIKDGTADFVKAEYKREGTDAPVTKLVARPLFRKYFMELYGQVRCPLEGEVCAKKSTFEKLHFCDDWGVDVGLVLSAFKNNLRIENIYLGKKIHNPSFKLDIEELEDMAYDVLTEILRNVKEEDFKE